MLENKDYRPDSVDKQLLRHLEQSGRLSFAELASLAGISKTPCWNRIQRLMEELVLCGFRATIDPEKVGLAVRALVHVVVDFHEYKAFEESIRAHPQVINCHAVTGEFDYVLEVMAKDIKQFDVLLRDTLSRLPGVQRFNTSLSTRVIKSNSPFMEAL